MSESLAAGTRIKTIFGGEVEIISFIAEGGQGAVYVTNYNGNQKALKWYKKSGLGTEPNSFYENIKQNIMRGSPSPEFLWPQDITEWREGTFGYIMDLRPEGYFDISEFLLLHANFKSYRTMVDAALSIVSAFWVLHNSGYSYQDINDGNFFINPENGKVLIADNDNVAPDRTRTGIKGKPRYMAPEIVRGETMPNSMTDLFSMALVLYRLFCLDHPLEGKLSFGPATPALNLRVYGTEPRFIMDPTDDSNGPDHEVHINSLRVWPCLPQYIKEIFIASFSQKALHKPNARPREIDWLNVLTRFRSDIVSCTCGNEAFTTNGQSCVCDDCGRMINIPFSLKLLEYNIPVVKGSRIYRCQLGVCNEKEALLPIAQVFVNTDTKKLYIRNKGSKRWSAVNTKGESKKVAPGEVVPIKDGIYFTAEGQKVV